MGKKPPCVGHKQEKESFSRGVAFGSTLRGTAGQRKLEGNQKQIALVRVHLRQSGLLFKRRKTTVFLSEYEAPFICTH